MKGAHRFARCCSWPWPRLERKSEQVGFYLPFSITVFMCRSRRRWKEESVVFLEIFVCCWNLLNSAQTVAYLVCLYRTLFKKKWNTEWAVNSSLPDYRANQPNSSGVKCVMLLLIFTVDWTETLKSVINQDTI